MVEPLLTSPQLFPLEKILGITASEYCESKGRRLSDYDIIGVEHIVSGSGNESWFERNEGFFRMRIPPRTEVVVNYTNRLSKGGFCVGGYRYARGDALIPKKSPE